jgi:hypothetical protein
MIDRKFKILAVNPCNGKIYTEENAMLFCAKDLALLGTLHKYMDECIRLNCGEEHIESIGLLIDRVRVFQQTIHAKVPDTDTDCEIDRCIGGNV